MRQIGPNASIPDVDTLGGREERVQLGLEKIDAAIQREWTGLVGMLRGIADKIEAAPVERVTDDLTSDPVKNEASRYQAKSD